MTKVRFLPIHQRNTRYAVKLYNECVSTGNKTSISSFSFKSLLPASQDFFRYGGSLTTPGCAEAVFWTIFQNPVTCSSAQVLSHQRICIISCQRKLCYVGAKNERRGSCNKNPDVRLSLSFLLVSFCFNRVTSQTETAHFFRTDVN